ncbi:MAG: pyridoxamine 5'-phosphate oxidase family protein [Pseudomonadota bacterium]
MTPPTLEDTLNDVWQRLGRGVADRRAPARHPVLATAGPDGGEARMVVLRGADRASGCLEIHTDAASAKVAELRANPKATVLIWDPKARLQIRLRVDVTITVGDGPAWARVPDTARGVYGGSPPPGAPIDTPGDHAANPTPARFAVLTCTIREIETLTLDDPHRRARFRDNTAGWIAP